MKKCIDTLKKGKKELWDAVLLIGILIAIFLIFVLSTFKDLPFIYNQF